MTQLRSSSPAAAPAPASNTTSSSAGGSTPSGSMIVTVHAALLVLTVAVVWATTGKDPGSLADAAGATDLAAAPLAAAQPSEVAAVESRPMATTPHTMAAPVPAALATPSFTRPAAEPKSQPVAVPVATPTDTPAFDPMVAIPEPGAAFPPAMPLAPEDDPHYAFGGLYGTPGATRLVYLIDASGSLIDTLPFILNELQESLSHLKAEQSFAVLFFSGDQVIEAPPYGMKRATTQAVRQTSQWIDPGSGRLIASGPANAKAGIRRALAYQPDAIILLSDGLTGGGDAAMGKRARLLSLIGTANTQDVVFHTLQVRRPDPLSTPTRLGTLELIALQSGGVHRYLGEEDLLPE